MTPRCSTLLSASSDIPAAEKADKTNRGHIAAPFAGVVTLTVAEGDKVSAGDPIATIEAMKMEAAITAPRSGLISRTAVAPVQQVEGGDLLTVVTVAEETSPE